MTTFYSAFVPDPATIPAGDAYPEFDEAGLRVHLRATAEDPTPSDSPLQQAHADLAARRVELADAREAVLAEIAALPPQRVDHMAEGVWVPVDIPGLAKGALPVLQDRLAKLDADIAAYAPDGAATAKRLKKAEDSAVATARRLHAVAAQ